MVARSKRCTKNRCLASGVKSKRGFNLAELRKRKAELKHQARENEVQPSNNCQGPSTSTPKVSRKKIKDSLAEIDCTSIALSNSTFIMNENSRNTSHVNSIQDNSRQIASTDSLHDHGYFTLINDENQEITQLSDNAPSLVNIEDLCNETNHVIQDIEVLDNNHENIQIIQATQESSQCKETDEEKDFNLEQQMKGGRMVDITFYEDQMRALNDHKTYSDCKFNDMTLVKEKLCGLGFIRTWKCKVCNLVTNVYSHRYLKDRADPTAGMNINQAVVAATILAGIGETALGRVLSGLDIPMMSSATFSKYRAKIATNLEEVAIQDMYNSAMKAKEIARARGDITPDDFVLVPVIIDGAWCQRTYRNTYNSTGGCGAIIAADTNEVLYIGIKNKFCVICTKAKNKGQTPKEHTCFQNWSEGRSSASMEAASIVEGFLQSESMYGIRYHKMIADGDSSVYKCILDAHPYENLIVQKIECRNHLLRNFCSNITAYCLTTSQRDREMCSSKNFVLQKLSKLRCGIRKAINYWSEKGVSSETMKSLEKDLINAPSHVFGEHMKCAEIGYFCDGKPKDGEINMVPILKKSGTYQAVMERIDRLVTNSKSLLHNVTTNAVESFNAIIASKISGKRINYTARDSYKARVHSAVLTLAHGEPFRKLHKKITNTSPGLYAKLMERRALHKRIGQRGRKQLFKGHKNKINKGGTADYGPMAAAPDLETSILQTKMERKIEEIKERHKDIVNIELETRGQSDSVLWFQIRRNLITASHVGKICKLKSTTSTAVTVNSILYSQFDNDGMKWGREHEKTAITAVEDHFELEIIECGLFIHKNHYYVGASPDGLVGDDGIIEVKCPYKSRDMSVEKGVEEGFIDYLDKNTLELKKSSNYYHQVQAQLEVTDRSFCIFTVWTSIDWVAQSISRDKEFWEQKMPKIENFFFKSLLPELVDSRKRRSLPLRSINIDGEECSKLEKSDKPTKKETSKNTRTKNMKAKNPDTKNLAEKKTHTKKMTAKKTCTKKMTLNKDSVSPSIASNSPISLPSTSSNSVSKLLDNSISLPSTSSFTISATPVIIRNSSNKDSTLPSNSSDSLISPSNASEDNLILKPKKREKCKINKETAVKKIKTSTKGQAT